MGFWDDVKEIIKVGLPAALDEGETKVIYTTEEKVNKQYSEKNSETTSNANIAGPGFTIDKNLLMVGGLTLVGVLVIVLLFKK